MAEEHETRGAPDFSGAKGEETFAKALSFAREASRRRGAREGASGSEALRPDFDEGGAGIQTAPFMLNLVSVLERGAADAECSETSEGSGNNGLPKARRFDPDLILGELCPEAPMALDADVRVLPDEGGHVRDAAPMALGAEDSLEEGDCVPPKGLPVQLSVLNIAVPDAPMDADVRVLPDEGGHIGDAEEDEGERAPSADAAAPHMGFPEALGDLNARQTAALPNPAQGRGPAAGRGAREKNHVLEVLEALENPRSGEMPNADGPPEEGGPSGVLAEEANGARDAAVDAGGRAEVRMDDDGPAGVSGGDAAPSERREKSSPQGSPISRGAPREMGSPADGAAKTQTFASILANAGDDASGRARPAGAQAHGVTQPGSSYALEPNEPSGAFADGLTAALEFMRGEEMNEARIVVEPPALGRIDVSLNSSAQGVEAVFKVDNEYLRQMLQNQLDALKSSLQAQGIHVFSLAVDIKNRDDQRGRGDLHGAKGRTRRVAGLDADDGETQDSARMMRLDLESGILHWVA